MRYGRPNEEQLDVFATLIGMQVEDVRRDYCRLRLPFRVPGKVGKAYRSGANLSTGAPTGGDTWEEFLAANTARPEALRAAP